MSEQNSHFPESLPNMIRISFKNAVLRSFGQQPLKHNNVFATPAELQYKDFSPVLALCHVNKK